MSSAKLQDIEHTKIQLYFYTVVVNTWKLELKIQYYTILYNTIHMNLMKYVKWSVLFIIFKIKSPHVLKFL